MYIDIYIFIYIYTYIYIYKRENSQVLLVHALPGCSVETALAIHTKGGVP
jgi:hypothetical protein